jgi:hypothetical protein
MRSARGDVRDHIVLYKSDHGPSFGRDFRPPRELQFITPRTAALRRLLGLHAATGALAENAPEIIA